MPPKTAVENFKSMMSTRSSNKNVHPGQVVIDASHKCQSVQEMEQVRAEEARAQEEQQRQVGRNLRAVADIEDRLQREDIVHRGSMHRLSNQPAFCPPPEASANEQGKAEQRIGESLTLSPPVSHSAGNREILESEPSGEEYEPQDEGKSEIEDNNMSAEEEEGLGDKPTQKRRGKAPKLGCRDIDAVRKVTSASSSRSTTDAVHKHKGSESIVQQSLKAKRTKKHQQQVGGVIPGWDATQSRTQAPTTGTGALNSDSMVQMGGFVCDHETDDVERMGVTDLRQGGNKKLNSMISISDTKPLICSQPWTKQEQRGGAKKSTLNHLPQGAGSAFTELVAPLAKITAGALPAWEGLSVQQIQHIVDDIYGPGTYTIKHDDVWCDLVRYRLSNWQNAFHTHARTAVNDHMAAFAGTDHSRDDVIDYVQYFTEPIGNPPSAPFHWKDWSLDDDTGVIKRSGLFENDLIIFTLAHAHFSKFEEVPNTTKMKMEEFPAGAVILALQAVEHAFKFWTTGKFVKDKMKHFSADKYDDKKEQKMVVPGKSTIIITRCASLYLKTIQNVSINKWAAIFDQVSEILNAGKKKKKGHSKSASLCVSSNVFEESAPEFVLCSDDE